MLNAVARKEKKYLLKLQEAKKQEFLVKQIIKADEHNKSNGYIVRSLYFDTPEEMDYQNKKDGVEIRRKIRLRVYSPNDEYALLEIKQKQGENQLKRSLKVKREDAIELTKGKYTCLLKYQDKFALECYGIMNMYCYKPKTIVQYNRKAYIAKENKIRITVASNLIATESNMNVFEENLKMYPVFEKDYVVLEVKYNGFLLSYIKDILDNVKHSETSVSKYCLARQVSMNYLFL